MTGRGCQEGPPVRTSEPTEAPGPEIGDRLADSGLGVHHEGTAGHRRFVGRGVAGTGGIAPVSTVPAKTRTRRASPGRLNTGLGRLSIRKTSVTLTPTNHKEFAK